MNRTALLSARSLLLLGTLALASACCNDCAVTPQDAQTSVAAPLDPAATTATVALVLEEPPTCGSCIAGYKQVLGALPGCGRVEATPNDPKITVHYDPTRVDVARIIDALEASGDHAQQVP